jgi:hypothetical protein
MGFILGGPVFGPKPAADETGVDLIHSGPHAKFEGPTGGWGMRGSIGGLGLRRGCKGVTHSRSGTAVTSWENPDFPSIAPAGA